MRDVASRPVFTERTLNRFASEESEKRGLAEIIPAEKWMRFGDFHYHGF
jgi:hypothetical protein